MGSSTLPDVLFPHTTNDGRNELTTRHTHRETEIPLDNHNTERHKHNRATLLGRGARYAQTGSGKPIQCARTSTRPEAWCFPLEIYLYLSQKKIYIYCASQMNLFQ